MHRRNSNAFVLNSGGVPGQAVNRPLQQQPGVQGNLDSQITHASQIDKGFFHCQEHRSFDPYINYEVVRIQTTNRNHAHAPPDTFHILNFPIDKLCDQLTARATQLSNLRSITFYNPLSWETFMTNYIQITEMAFYILTNVASLTRITICADMLSDKLFRALSSQLHLREVEILLPTVPFPFPNRLPQIGEVLNRGIPQLPQVNYLKIPLQLVTDNLLSCLGRLPYLNILKTTGSANETYPGRFFIRCMGPYLHIRNLFGSLQLLDVRDNLTQEDFFSKNTLTKIFPNTKFIKS